MKTFGFFRFRRAYALNLRRTPGFYFHLVVSNLTTTTATLLF